MESGANMDLIQFLSQYLQIDNISAIAAPNQPSISKLYAALSEFDGILEGKEYHFECRYSDDKTILDLNLIDHIPFSKKGIENLPYRNYCILYLCDFEQKGTEKLAKELNDSALIISPATKEIRHIYLFKNDWGKSLPADIRLNKEFGDSEFDEAQPENRFIMGHRSEGRFKRDKPEMPLISIIMPTFNSEKTIEQSLQSIVYQDYPNYELLIVDGLSTDRTLEIVKKYERYIDGVVSEEDVNIFDAINKGTRLSRGEYSVFLGSDDLLMPYALEEIATAIRAGNRPDYFYGDGLRLKADKKTFYIKTFIRAPKFKEYRIMHITMYITRELFEEFNGFDIKWDINADADFKLKLIRRNKTGIKIDAPLGVFRDGGYSSYAKGKIKSIYRLCRKHSSLNYKFYLVPIRFALARIAVAVLGKKQYLKLVDKVKNR